MIINYDKIVRDKIPDIIASQGKEVHFRICTNQEAIQYLERKLDEELLEFKNSHSIEEIGDLIDVCMAIATKSNRIDILEESRVNKEKNKGGFKNNIILIKGEI